jgi:hypothetical protein
MTLYDLLGTVIPKSEILTYIAQKQVYFNGLRCTVDMLELECSGKLVSIATVESNDDYWAWVHRVNSGPNNIHAILIGTDFYLTATGDEDSRIFHR